MKWLTIPQIKRRSKTAKGALKVSYEHWNQLYTATAKELRDAYREISNVFVDCRDCGLCMYHHNRHKISKCGECPLRSCDYNSLYSVALDTLDDWCGGKGDWHAWKRACKAVRDKLAELVDQGTK